MNYRAREVNLERGKVWVIETEYMGRWEPIDKDGVFGWSVKMNQSIEYYPSKDLAEKRILKFKK
jgi:hypothetical protein